MLELLQMWACVEVLGLICLPLTMTIFHNLPDRGWAFSKGIGVAVLAFAVWFPLMCFQILPFSQLFVAGVFLILLACNVIGFMRVRSTLVKVIRMNRVYIVNCELVFLGMMFLLGYIRSYAPDIRSYEMFMDEGFLSAIMRSQHFPPNDMWFAGHSINYYYYAHFTIAMLAKLIGQIPSVAFNTGICMFFGLTAVHLFGVTCNIVAWTRYTRKRTAENLEIERADTALPSLLTAAPYGLLSIFMGLVMGNLAATQQWWKNHGDLQSFDWFAPSRVVDKTINEFPAFSFLLSCFHAHVLTLAFTILAIGLAFNLLLEHDGKGLFVFGRGWRLVLTMGATALVLGGLFTMNGWDFPTYVGLTLLCIICQQWLVYKGHFCWEMLLDMFSAGASLTALSFILYVPFYLNFVSPSQGIGIVGDADRSPLGSEILIYGIFGFIFLSLLVATVFVLPLWRKTASPDGSDTAAQVVSQRLRERGLLALIGLALIDIAASFILKNSTTFVVAGTIAVLGFMLMLYCLRNRGQAFTLLLGAVAFGLVAACEIVFLKDVFAASYPRMNTVFKFYFQAWALLSITSGAGLFFILDAFRPSQAVERSVQWMQRVVEALWGIGLAVLLLAGMVYPIAGSYTRSMRINPVTQAHYLQRSNSLDGLDYLQTYNPGDYYAIRWLNSHVSGDPGIVEANGPDYTDYGRVSAFTGLPSPMQWAGHEYQWRVNWMNKPANSVDFNNRGSDVDTIYTNPQPGVVLATLAKYHIQYIYVGGLELEKYPTTNLHRFSTFMQTVYSANGVTIYRVK